MNFTNREKELLLSNAPVLSRITLYAESGEVLQVFNENDYLVDWDYEDFRYVPDQGFIGQFVERLLDGHLMNIPNALSLEDKEISVEIAVYDSTLQEQVYHNYGRFIITKIEKEDTTGSYKFESSDYTKKFNEVYTGGVTFPCTALKLLNSACDQVGVELDTSNNAQAVDYIVSVDGLQAGNYAFLINGTYYNFILNEGLTSGNLLMLKGDKLILRKVTSDYEIIREEIPYGTSETSSNTVLSDEPYDYYELINDDFIVNDNQFTENNTCRDVVRSVAQLSYTWARINENNKLCLDFVKNDNVDSYDEIDTDKYYEATVTGDKVEPINKVLIGMSQVEGENIVKEQDNDLLGVDTIYGGTTQPTLLGINRIKNGDFTNGTTNWDNWGSPPTREIIYEKGIDKYVVHVVSNTTKFQGYEQNTGISVEPNKKYTISVKARGNYLCVGIHWNNSSNTIITQSWNTMFNANQSQYKTFTWTVTCPNDNNITRFNIMVGDNTETAHEFWYTNVQVQEGETATEYEPFTNLISSPNPDYPQPVINVSGSNQLVIQNKNIYDASFRRENGSIKYSGNVSSVSEEDGIYTMVASGTDPYIWNVRPANYVYTTEAGKLYKFDSETYRVNVSNNLVKGNYVTYYDKNKISLGYINKNSTQFTISKNDKVGAKYFSLRFGNQSAVSGTTYEFSVEMEKGTSVGEFVSHSEKNISLFATENLFDKDNANILNAYIGSGGATKITNADNTKMIYVPCKPNYKYTISKTSSARFYAGYTKTTPQSNVDVFDMQGSANREEPITISTGNNAKYIVAFIYKQDADTLTLQQILDTIQIEEGSIAHPYIAYNTNRVELNALNDYSDYEENTINLFDYARALLVPIKTGGGVTLINNRDGSFTINGTGNTTEVFGGNYVDLTHEETVKLLRAGTLKFKCDYVSIPRVVIEGFDGSTRLFNLDNGTTSVQTTTITQAMLDNVNFKLRYSFYSNSGNTITPLTIHPMVYQDGDGTFEPIKYKKVKDNITRNTGKNLLDKDNIHVVNNAYINSGSSTVHASRAGLKLLYIPITGGKRYTISKQIGMTFRVATSIDEPAIDVAFTQGYERTNIIDQADTYTLTTNNNANYLLLNYYRGSNPSENYTEEQILSTIQIEEGSTATDYEPYGNGEWYKCTKIGKYTFTGASNENWYLSGNNCMKCNALNTTLNYPKMKPYYNYSQNRTLELYSNYGLYSTGSIIVTLSTKGVVGLGSADTGGGTTDAIYLSANGQTVADFKTKLASNPLICYYIMETPTYEKITYQPLIDQLNELQDTPLFEGTNHITVDTLNEQPSLDITITDLEQDSTSYSGKLFEITGHDYDKGGSIYIYDNPLTYTEELRRIAINGAENLFGLTYTPMEVNSIGHPWLTGKEFVKVTNLENQELYFYPFDRKISYSGILTTDLSAQAKNEVAQKYENRNNVVDKINHTEISVNKANGTIEVLSKTVNDNKEEFTQWQSTEYNSLKSTVGEIDRDLNVGNDSIHSRLSSVEQTTTAITNMFQITGGINVIRNSAFLLQDNVWEFTDSGTNPYHTPLGASYNSTLSGQTVSVAEIKARSTKIKSKSENITNLILNTKYTFNFYHKQDNNMTTTIKMYSTENNSSKAFNDIVITGQQEFKNYEVSFTPTTYTNYTIEIIVTGTASVGYAYLYDMMLNSGDKQAWQPASDEIYSTTLQMSRLGLKVYSVGDGTITLLGSDGMSTWETSDGVTLGRLVSMRTEAGDRVKTVTSEALYLTKDIREENANRWVETIVTISGTPYKVEYIESGGQ